MCNNILNNNFIWRLLIILMIGIVKIPIYCQFIPIENKMDIENEYQCLNFNNYYRVFVEEKYLNDNGLCDNCSIIEATHHIYDIQQISDAEKCFGDFENCIMDTPALGAASLAAKIHRLETDIAYRVTFPEDHIYRLKYQLQHTCGTCICTCHANRMPTSSTPLGSDGIIDSICLDPVSVEVSKNYVITGVQFVQVDNILMLKIKRGKLQSGPSILRGTNSWIAPRKTCKKIAKINYHNTYFLLDDVLLPEDYVVTDLIIRKCDEKWDFRGRKIRTVKDCGDDDFFHLMVYGTTMINAENGITDNYVEGVRSGVLSLKGRTNLISNELHSPLNVHTHKKLSEPGRHYVKFQLTDWQHDRGKHLVPFIDSRPVETSPARPLGGVGFYYFGTPGYGGYLSPTIYSHDA